MVGYNLLKWLNYCIAKDFTKCVGIFIFTYIIAFKKCFFRCASKVNLKCSSIINAKISYFTHNKNLLTFGLFNIVFFLSFIQINVYAQIKNTISQVPTSSFNTSLLNRSFIDSDNDGIYDIVEAGTAFLDVDKDGFIDCMNILGSSLDLDSDGLADSVESINGNDQGTRPRNTINSTRVDYLNADSDGDNCSDVNEGQNSLLADGNNDTYFNPNNLQEPLTISSGAVMNSGKVIGANYNLGNIPSVIDQTISICNTLNPCSDGAVAGIITQNDADGDGINNVCDLDDDNDGILDAKENPRCFSNSDVWNGSSSIPIALENENIVVSAFHTNMANITNGSGSGVGDLQVLFDRAYTDANSIKYPSGKSIAGKVIYRFELTNAVVLKEIEHDYSGNAGSAQGTFEPGSIIRLQAKDYSNNRWVNIALPYTTTGIYDFNGGRDIIVTNLDFPSSRFRLIGVSGTTLATTGKFEELWVKIKRANENFYNGACIPSDKDKDQIPNYLDLDSDNDGIYDIVEAGTTLLDVDKDGRVDNNLDNDSDGVSDIVEGINGPDKGTTPRQTTSGIDDYLNSDSDNDGCSDVNEAYDNKNIDGVGEIYYNPNNLVEPLTLVSGAITASGKVVEAPYNLGDVAKVIDKNFSSSICFSPPDYYPTLFIGKTVVNGKTAKIDFIIFVAEANGEDANGLNPVEVRIADSDRFSFEFDKNLTTLNGTKINNSNWNYRKESGLHKFIYEGNGEVFLGNAFSRIGVNETFHSPENSLGQVPLKVTVKSDSGGQVNTRNDNDQDIIQYNNKN